MSRKQRFITSLIIPVILSSFLPCFSQETSPSKISTGSDFYSCYIWRGSIYGTGPAIQPSIKYTCDRLIAGAWGSFDFSGYQEADLFLSFSLTSWLSAGLTDYYFPDLKYTDFSQNSGSHAYEINAGFLKWNFSLSANYIINKAGGAGSLGGDKYFQAGYSFKNIDIFIGAGDGWHTLASETGDDRFAVCNLGIGTSKTIKVTDSFNIPVTGQLIFNPDKNRMFLVVGFTL